LKYKKLLGEKVSLGPIDINDAEKWAEWLNDLSVSIPLGSEAYTSITVEEMKNDFNWFSKNNKHVFSIIDNESNNSIGRSIIFDIDHINRKAMLGLFIGEKEYWNKGYGRESLNLLLDYAFNLLNLNSMMLGVSSFNKRAIKCYESVGFKEIGRRRQARIIGNKYYDGILMDILAEEFDSKVISKYLE